VAADAPRVSVVVPAHNATGTLARTLAALAAQDLDGPFEVIVVDDASDDGTAAVARVTPGVTVISEGRLGAAGARNRGVAESRAPALAFTDADCFPTPGWLSAGLAALAGGAELVQGRVAPDPGARLGPFDRTLWVESERGFYETANLFTTRELFDRIGGFDDWLDTGRGKHIAEDVWFGWRAIRAGARTGFAPDALLHHAVFPRTPWGYLAERPRLRYFPAIARKIPEFRHRTLYRRLFHTRRSAAFDAALTGLALAVRQRSPIPLVAVAPYARLATKDTLRFRRRAPVVAAVRVAADAVNCAALLYGSVRWRSPVL
jgi:glycosyltransferase involved in cell wall biosynthesis